MRLAQDKMAKIKTYVHGGQAVLIAIAWLMIIIIFTREGHSDGRIGWTFGLVSTGLGSRIAEAPWNASPELTDFLP